MGRAEGPSSIYTSSLTRRQGRRRRRRIERSSGSPLALAVTTLCTTAVVFIAGLPPL